MRQPDAAGLATELVRILAASGDAVTIVAAKEKLCGTTRPISDLHAAMVFAVNRAWIRYSTDYLCIMLASAGVCAANAA